MTNGEQTPDELDLDEIRGRLEADLEAVTAEIAERTKPPEAGGSLQFGKRIGEGTSEAISRFAEVGVANDLEAIRLRTERALAKLDEGSYGVCDNCERQIPAGRLRVAPASSLCVECAS
jgi:DnaK suppressor protein